VARARFLHDSLAGHGADSRFELVTGAGHEPGPMLPPAQRFLAGLLGESGWARG
jgi:hypothetical protein